MRPLIGINLNYNIKQQEFILSPDYVEAIEVAGGIPVALPIFPDHVSAKEVIRKLNGVVFTGGRDINPRKYGERKHPRTNLLYSKKAKSDEILMKLSLEMKKNVLAICYGCQLLNVTLGGTLYQHIPSLKFTGSAHKTEGKMHRVELIGILREMIGKEKIMVNSYHHQSVNKVGHGLEVVARSEDSLVEGISFRDKFVLGVQWHPEMMQRDEHQKRLFRKFITSC